MKERVEYIDVARGIAMLLVIVGHCNQTVDCTLNRFILSFHMPLFFFLSGIFATTTTKGTKNLMGRVNSKAKSLLIPQMFLCLIGGIKPIIIAVIQHSSCDIWNTFGFFRWWFLPTLFICSVLYMLIGMLVNLKNVMNKIIYMIISLILIFVSIEFNKYDLHGFFLCLQIVPVASFFYVLGNIIRPYMAIINNTKTISLSIAACIVFCICFSIANVNTPVMLYKNEYGNLPLFFITSISGCFLTIYVSTYIKDSILLKYIGRKCVAFYVWQFLVVSLCISVASRGIKMIPNVENDNIITFMAFSMALPISYIIVKTTQKHIPGIYGYKR